MIGALHRAAHDEVPILNPEFLATLEDSQLEHILRGTARIPLLEERGAILREVGQVITQNYGGNFSNFVKKYGTSAQDLVEAIASKFPSFYDSSLYKGKEVLFHKRAQLLVSDINEMTYTKMGDINSLTACADYILPMVLRYIGILKYAPSLASKVDNGRELLQGSPEEVEIRANTLYAVHLIAERISLTSMQVNDRLWLMGKTVPDQHYYHRTRTTAY